jgi:hypothetical protein
VHVIGLVMARNFFAQAPRVLERIHFSETIAAPSTIVGSSNR